MRIVWICHFSNDEIQKLLKPRRKVREYAPWIPIAIRTVEGDERFDLHIISPYPYIAGVHKFELRGIHYYFYNPFVPILGYSWPKFFPWDYISNFWTNKHIVKRIVSTINPDVIHLFGAENQDYSPTILPLIGKYPSILTVQGFCSHTTQSPDYRLRRKIAIEKDIIKRMSIAFYESKHQGEDIRKFNPSIELFWHFYGSYEVKAPTPRPSIKYDVVFFARINRDKGIIDIIDALDIIKRKYKGDVTLCVIGDCKDNYYKEYALKKNLKDNIVWVGFLPTRDDVHKLAVQAKVSVLPTYHDINPGTIIESMFLEIPVVAYATDNIPEINDEGEVIKLAEKGNVEEIAVNIVTFLNDDNLRNSYAKAARKRAFQLYAPSRIQSTGCLIKGYQRSIEIFHH